MSFSNHNPYGTRPTIQIISLTMQETGVYNRMYQRPYETNRLSGHVVEDIHRRVNESGKLDITGNLISGLAGQFLTPSVTPQNELHVPNGWDTRRMHWFMEVQITTNTGSVQTMLLQGYTSHVGVSSGLIPGQTHIDPNMIFYINSYIVTNKVMTKTETGYYEIDVIKETAHVLNGQIIRTPNSQGDAISMRPKDVFSGMQSATYGNTLTYFDDLGGLNDTRVTFNNESIRSTRNNALPSNYIAKVVNGWRQSTALAEFGADTTDLYGRAVELVYENPLAENLFIRALSNIIGMPGCTHFRESDLKAIQPDFPINIGVHSEVARANTNYAGVGAYWDSVNHLVVPATIIGNAVPAIMMENYITSIHLHATNHTVDGQFHVDIFEQFSPTRADITRFLNNFVTRLKSEVLHDITFGNQQSLVLDLKMSVFSNSHLSIAIGNNSKEDYFIPSFCDSLISPVATQNVDTFNGLVHDLSSLLSGIETVKTGPTSTTGIVNYNI